MDRYKFPNLIARLYNNKKKEIGTCLGTDRAIYKALKEAKNIVYIKVPLPECPWEERIEPVKRWLGRTPHQQDTVSCLRLFTEEQRKFNAKLVTLVGADWRPVFERMPIMCFRQAARFENISNKLYNKIRRLLNE
jgi:hypothetical protein